MHDHQAKNNLDFSGESKAGPQKNVTSVVEDIKAFTSQNIAEACARAKALSAARALVRSRADQRRCMPHAFHSFTC